MTTKMQLDSIGIVAPERISGYLSTTGWHEDGEISDVATIWHRPEPELEEQEILLPTSNTLKDYKQRVFELLTQLSVFEGRRFSDIANDINNFEADTIKIKVIHPEREPDQ